MGIYLPNMEMPQEGFVEILVRDDGTVLQTGQSYRIDGTDYYTPYVGEMPIIYKAVSVPPHGRLIDADALYSHIKDEQRKCNGPCDGWSECQVALGFVNTAPTIIPAEEGE